MHNPQLLHDAEGGGPDLRATGHRRGEEVVSRVRRGLTEGLRRLASALGSAGQLPLAAAGLGLILLGIWQLRSEASSPGAAPVPVPVPAPAPSAHVAPCDAPSSPGATSMQLINNEWSDGVVFCRGPVEGTLRGVFKDASLSQTVVKSDLDCAVPGSPAAVRWGEGVPQGSTLAIGLKRGQSHCLYIAPDGQWPSGACWYQDEASNKAMSIAKGPQYMSEVEFTIQENAKGQVWYDMSSVEGVSGGITMNYTDARGRTQTDTAVPGPFVGSTLKVVRAPGIGFRTVLSDKNFLGACTCDKWDPLDPVCNSDACRAGCPGSLVDNACGQHRCRTFYAQRYKDHTSYCGWLYEQKAQTYCWAMDEWRCVDEHCGYGGPDQPAENCSSKLPAGAPANSYSCGHGTNLPSGVPGKNFWTNGPGCKDKMVVGVPTNPAPPRDGGRITISFESLPWLHEAPL
mmetsp:Transcript_64056/g.179212  ORF Transcript_64056/g.179212 Transcript_64056/m.179212 type:complete len:456 (+) Transcript_64056:45-1412(+)